MASTMPVFLTIEQQLDILLNGAPDPRLPPGSVGWYETATGCCGYQILFDKPLTDWTEVLCRKCGHFTTVR